MLKQRIITALVLIAILAVVLTVAAPYGFPPFALLTVGIVIGEWLALLAFSRATCIVVAVVAMVGLASVHASRFADGVSFAVWTAAGLVWIALALGLFVRGGFPEVARWRYLHATLAVFLPAACWFGLVDAYLGGGLAYLVSILAIVWAADIAAYFAGRAFGKRKLAPAISPGKTWAGAIGGAVAALAFAVVTIAVPVFSGTYFAVLVRTWSLPIVLVVAVALVVLSIVGDLFESHLKRQRGVKDSGRLLPGHGGVFDRVDALLPVVPVALLLQRLA